jgi:hypothetical protein
VTKTVNRSDFFVELDDAIENALAVPWDNLKANYHRHGESLPLPGPILHNDPVS